MLQNVRKLTCKVWLQFQMSHWSMGKSWRGVWFWRENLWETLFTGAVSKLLKKFVHIEDVHSGLILESKGICPIFQKKGPKKGKKQQNTWTFVQKRKKFEDMFKKGKPHSRDYRMHETARIRPETPSCMPKGLKVSSYSWGKQCIKMFIYILSWHS